MENYRINKIHGILLEDDRVPTLIENSFDSDTRTMLENLVREGNGTTQLLLDPSNTDQGYISYTPPSNIGQEDDYFSFDSFNFSVQLPLSDDGTILVNSSGNLYNNIIRTYNQFDDGEFDIFVSVLSSVAITNYGELSSILTNHKYPASGEFTDRTTKVYPIMYITYSNGKFIFGAGDGNSHEIGTSLDNLEIDPIPLTNEI